MACGHSRRPRKRNFEHTFAGVAPVEFSREPRGAEVLPCRPKRSFPSRPAERNSCSEDPKCTPEAFLKSQSDLQILFRSLHQMTDVEESRMLKTAESVARDKSIKSLNRAEVSAGSSSFSSEKIDPDPDEISQFRVALTNAAQQNHLPSFFPYLHRLLEHPTVASGTFSFARHCPTIQTRVSRLTDAQFLKPLLHAVGPRVRSMLQNMQVESCMDAFAILMRMTGTGAIRRAKVQSSLVDLRADTMDARLLLPSAIEQRERELGELGQGVKPEDKLLYPYSALCKTSGSAAASAQGIYDPYRDGVVPLERARLRSSMS